MITDNVAIFALMKQYIMRNRVVTIVTLLILATTTGCGKLDTDNMLLGTWQSVQKESSIASDTDLEITFLSDGTASFQRFDVTTQVPLT